MIEPEFLQAAGLIAQVPLVVAFIYFSIKIINLYLSNQREISAGFAETVKGIVASWSAAMDRRDQETRAFLSEYQRQFITAGEIDRKTLNCWVEDWRSELERRDAEQRAFLTEFRAASFEMLRSVQEAVDRNTQAITAVNESRIAQGNNRSIKPGSR